MAASPPPPPSPCPLSPSGDQSDDAAAVCTDDDEDTLRRVMQIFGAKTGDFGYAGHGNDSEPSSDDECSASDDIAYLRRIQEQFLPFSSVPAVSSTPETPPIAKPIRSLPPPDTDDEEDFETLRAIQRRFAIFGGGETLKNFSPETSSTISVASEEDPHNLSSNLMNNDEHQEQSCIGLHKAKDKANKISVFAKNFIGAPNVIPSDTSLRNRAIMEDYQEHNHINFNEEDGFNSLSVRQFITSKFPKSVQNFVDALKKNRSCQRFIRRKLLEIESKMEMNKKLKERIKCLIDFHTAYRRKLSNSLCQKRDPRVRLISLRKQRPSRTNKENSKISSALFSSPEENPQVSNYMMVMKRFPVSFRERQWSNTEKDELLKGVKQQFQEMLFLNCMNFGSDFDGNFDSSIISAIDSANHQVTPEILRFIIPLVNWDRLASIYLPRRSGSSCESRWLNYEDPMINHSPWTLLEDKKLLFTAQERGLYNWIDMAVTLGTNRTPFQCLARYQRSLNPHILNREWTSEEDAKLYAGVENFGDNNWQLVASHLDGRTSNQCSVRWRNSLLPERKRVGRWSVEEDKRLKVSVILFGAKNWKKIAQFVPGRTQSQCRERWLNCLDPSLNLERWTEEEDSKLLAAIAEHGHSWSKVAAHLPGRTDNHCRRRWKSLLPDEVPKLKAAQKLKKTVLISNFVGRESERSSLGPNDFTPIICLPAPNIENRIKVGKRMSREQSNPTNKKRAPSSANKLKKARKKFKRSTDENSTESIVITSMIDSFGNLSLVSGENADAIDTSCFKRKRKRSLSIMRKGKLRGIDENSVNGIVNTNAGVAPSDLVCIPSINYDAAQNKSSKKRIKNLARNKQSRKSLAKTNGEVNENSSVGGLDITAETVPPTISENTCIKGTRKRTLRNKQSRKSEAKTKGGGEEYSSVDSLVVTDEATDFDLPLVTFTPDVSENACIKRTRKRSLRNKKSHDKTKRDGAENSSSGGLVITVEAAHFDLPLLTVPPSVS